ncbi:MULTISPECIES: alpha-L-arabinofuranosidase C-terminal domain-containing protein [unclassified Arcicella]|uniref:alpha-L-arabinofuranosidase C-terminal domain-containing protein n=1 Tax=unclassified Arcicella TaxID=2644986 RepID=UPI0028575F4D|nr:MULTISPECIES: alpha-L-arabinofuranosidase C-terminal domain-containing protein [unclassified Arcicella]MDR6562198.1 alpha-L-arabinofuranosidase [Arcicella sp. BE51]MDR6812108.1 alpha-L-arabinofuranosidase [Arcicella sp. BE140]MDR6823419.1 alpha-L-arabinofuranosidase [Arcicella sp. BE139]
MGKNRKISQSKKYKYMRVCLLYFLIFPAIISFGQSQTKKTETGKKISPYLFGLFFEDINYAADGGLYAELIQNRSFEYSPTDRTDWHSLSFWEYTTPGYSYGSLNVETSTPVHSNNPHYAVLNIEHVGEAGVGVKNHGFENIVIKQGEKYSFSMFARQLSSNPIAITISLQTPKGKVVAESKININTKDWNKYTATLTASASNDSTSLVILATTKGKIALDVVSLFPEKTFLNRQNGLRADLAQLLADMKPSFIRFPGGCLAHGDGLGNMYRWKNTVGPIEQRVEQKNIWGYHQTAGLGYYEYFQFCEDIGAKPLPVLPAAVSCQNSGGTWRIGGTGQKALPMDEMQEYIQEVLDLIEWANGPATSTWGAKRAAAGHPLPFNLEFVGIGNEDKITPEFEARFKMIYDAVRAKHPEITVIGTSGPFSDGEDFDKGWQVASNSNVPMIDEHYYKDPKWFLSNMNRYDTYDRKKSGVYLGEYASWGNKLYNAIAEAAYMTGLERNGDIVRMASYAPLLAKKNHTQWNTDMIFFDNSKISLTPNYHVQKMFTTNQGDYYYDNVIAQNVKDTTLAASCVKDSKTGDIILKFVNNSNVAKSMKVNLSTFKNYMSSAAQIVLSGNANAENTLEHPQNIAPVYSTVTVNKVFDYAAPAMSLTVIRIKTSAKKI